MPTPPKPPASDSPGLTNDPPLERADDTHIIDHLITLAEQGMASGIDETFDIDTLIKEHGKTPFRMSPANPERHAARRGQPARLQLPSRQRYKASGKSPAPACR